MVRAKFYVASVVENDPSNVEDKGYTINLNPVISGSEENKQFYKWTPGGSIQLSTINPIAAAQFEAGKEYYVDFTPAS